MAYKDLDVGRVLRDRERFARRTAERRAASLCPRCGERRPAPGRSVCEPCAEKKRKAERARYTARPSPPASFTAAKTRHDAAGSHAAGAGGATRSRKAAGQCMPVAASNIPLKAVQSARPAVR